ncbi:MAG: D-alanyl-D-alanine carboxypeptidase, partial [Hyphomicrobiaceae bacterium]|nr:D-alanyl-D-alanine carboxypeptidase [Hyphomicrobiaceae bacterium]
MHGLSALVVLAGLVLAALPARAQVFDSNAPFAFLYDLDTETVLYAHDADAPFAPASLTKLMTAEIVFGFLDENAVSEETLFRVTEDTWRRGGAPAGTATMFAEVNSDVSVGDLLSGLVVQLANDAALTLADGFDGSEEAFARRMTARASELGLTQTRFTNATGFPEPEGATTTVRDMVRLAIHVIRTR